MQTLEDFSRSLHRDDVADWISAGLIGDGIEIDGPFGPKPLVYADYVASGRALDQVEDFIRHNVLPYYANSHTQASYCGSYVTRLREAARSEVARMTGAGAGDSVVFTGSGSTAAINRIVALLDIVRLVAQGGRVSVLVGPYEHHSNLLPWRESGATVKEISEGDSGGPCLDALSRALDQAAGADLIVGAFSAASNVTGIVTDVDAVTHLLKSRGALAVWDYGCGAPYMAMDMKSGTDVAKDAIVFSPHKFPGGPGASGVMIVRNAVVSRCTPSLPGGGTVSFVSPWGHTYSDRIAAREEAGTPNVIGDIRVAMAMLVKEALGQVWLDARQKHLRQRAEAIWSRNPRLDMLGTAQSTALPIFSFRVRDGHGGYIHQQLFTRLLSDVAGIQARGGCACAGSYAHRLLHLDKAQSQSLERAISEGCELEKPGWVRLNLSALMTDEKADHVIQAVDALAFSASDYQSCYRADPATARFFPVDVTQETLAS
ncbi:aminotransferase class V-fold PLP-dependent enzyme [Marivita sp.]|jgi:selenocysteine lyase/cysteine desulfurase|uniref:aminotransferase class V-fold PLP-dependent enzyme n=1 Tax=Marivita sp. TaxID=2003365 RepID=UPI00262D4E32|nr:aminotransferase class V-fold PLP-dependent enzyme [Marivita sp.]